MAFMVRFIPVKLITGTMEKAMRPAQQILRHPNNEGDNGTRGDSSK
jgi:hypothetical protein